MSPPDPERVVIGYVARAKGVRGEVGIESLSWVEDRFDGMRRVWLQRSGQADCELRIETCRSDTRGPLLKFSGIDTPEAAREKLVGGYLAVDRAEVPSLPDGAFYVFEVVGCRVVDTDTGAHLGQVTEVLHMPTTDVYTVRRDVGGEVLVPAVRDFVTDIDVAAQRISVRGLAELLVDDGAGGETT